MPPLSISLANRAWESLLTAHTAVFRGFAAESVWRENDVTMREYDVLYTLAKCGAPARIGELQHNVLLSQPALSRMVDRLAKRGLLERVGDDADGRAVRVRLTPSGAELQQRVGRSHARSVARAVGGALDDGELRELERLTAKLIAGAARDDTDGIAAAGTDPASPTTSPTES
ncbi:MAG: winged helix-turn-helix transcriptional regulator [Actinobacteria bacterium]|nr:winged helix-turn-helix transcriptional regulator [Actinomycetota bacterium]